MSWTTRRSRPRINPYKIAPRRPFPHSGRALNRAYSLLTVKSVDTEKRQIMGWATTPTPDRVGDVVEPLGVEFKNPLPLLLYHDSKQPVGTVTFKKATKDGIEFHASIPAIEEPPSLKDRVDTAWASVKAGLLKGVSIGFRSLEEAFNKETNGYRFIRTEVLELSLVAVPANADATILGIKHLDLEQQAALRPAAPLPAGVSALSRPAGRRESGMKTTNEQIAELQQKQTAIADRIKVLAPSVTGEDVDATAATEYDELVKQTKANEARLVRLEALEDAELGTANLKGVNGQNSQLGSRSRGGFGYVSVTEPELPPGIAFTRATICKIASRMDYMPSWEIAKRRYPSHPSIAQYLEKTTIPGGTTTGTGSGSPQSGWGDDLLALNTTFAGGFLEFLRPQTIVGRLNLTKVPFNTRVQSQTTGGSALWVGQGVQKPVTKYDFDALNIGFAKIAAICVLSDELIRFSSPNAETLVRNQLANTIIERMDRDFIDPDVAAVANVSPASITRGATVLASAGASLANANTDIQSIIGQFIAVNQNIQNLAWIMPNSLALSLSLMLTSLGQPAFPTINVNGGTLAGYPVVTSQYASAISTSPTDLFIVILLNQSEIFLADDGQVSVDASNQASIEMSDNPASDAGNVMVSMYQTNQVALRAERYVNWARGRTSSVFVLGDVRWSA